MSRINTQMLMAVDGLYNKTLGDTDVCVTGQIVEVYLQDEKLFDKNLHTTTFSNGEIWTQQCRNRLQALLPLRYQLKPDWTIYDTVTKKSSYWRDFTIDNLTLETTGNRR